MPILFYFQRVILSLFGLYIIASFSYAQESQNLAGNTQANLNTGYLIPGRPLNPDISLIGLFSLSQFDTSDPITFEGGHDPKQNGFNLQQIELTLGSVIDPNFRGDSSLVLVNEDGATKIEIEEAYATTLDMPWNFQLKAGQFFTGFGRNNSHHPHTWNFANKPLVLGRMFGGDGLRNPGLQISWLTPLAWYSEIIVSAQNSTGETAASFQPEGKMRSLKDQMVLLRWNNFVSLSEEISLNLGGSLLNGPNGTPSNRHTTNILGGDVYWKYRKLSSLSFISLQAEVLKRSYGVANESLRDWGWYTELNYRLAEPYHRWMIGLRYDGISDKKAGTPITSPAGTDDTIDRDTAKRYRISPVVTFYPSEFTKLRLQYDYDRPHDLTNAQHAVHLQFEFLMGAHGSHKF